jgi:hypothetical protein
VRVCALPGALPYMCGFEFDYCGMEQRVTDQLDWARNQGPTDTEGTGPSAAYERDYYMYFEADEAQQENNRA